MCDKHNFSSFLSFWPLRKLSGFYLKVNNMKLADILNESFGDAEEIVVLDEGLFSVSPAIAAFAFKDSVFDKIGNGAKKIGDAVGDTVGKVIATKEKAKAKLVGRSGDKDDDTIYRLTKEQRKAMAYIYRKYGAEMVQKINKFRDNIMVPYSIIKRNVSRNKMLTNKEVLGMTKEEYFKYRESGRKKIEKKGSFLDDHKDLSKKSSEASEALNIAEKRYEDFKAGKIVDLTATNIEKIFDEAGIGRKNLNGWTEVELEKTTTEINKIMTLLADKTKASGEYVRVGGRGSKSVYESRAILEKRLKDLQEHGYSYANGKKTEDNNHHGAFKGALATYLLRREEIKKIKANATNSDYVKFYEKVLKDAIDSAKSIYKEKLGNLTSLKGTVELNQFEKKIWGLKVTGVENSGKIDDWYLKIKPEDFIETKYYGKSEKIIKAEKEMDRALKQLERELKKVMSEEDLAYCRKYRLFSNFLTVKELRDPKNMFKNGGEAPKISSKEENDSDFDERIKSALNKDFNTIRDLENARDKLEKEAKTKKLTKEEKEALDKLKKRLNPKNNSEATKTDRTKITTVLEKINNTNYTGKTQAAEAMKELEDAISDFKEVNGIEELKQFETDIGRARGKLAACLEEK